MAQHDYKHVGTHGVQESKAMLNLPTNTSTTASTEEDVMADVDEPPDGRTPRPSTLRLHDSYKNSFVKNAPPRCERKESLLTSALHSGSDDNDTTEPSRGMSCISTWSNNSASTAELTSDGGFTSPGTRTSTPSPPPPSSFHSIVPMSNKQLFEEPLTIVKHDEEYTPGPKVVKVAPSEKTVEATLGRKRCISFACGRKDSPKPVVEVTAKPAVETPADPPKRQCTIKFACPSKVSTYAPSKANKPRRAASPAPPPQKLRSSPKPSKAHRGSDSTVRNPSPVSVRKKPSIDRTRRLSVNSDLARSEAFRFHEFASSEEEVDEWLQESTCHRSRLTISDTLKVENGLRQLGEEAEEEALEDDQDDELDEEEDNEVDDDDDDLEDEDDVEDDDADSAVSDEGFQTDDEEGFAGSDDESDADSDYQWWAPGHSTAATSVEHLDFIRPTAHRSMSESSVGSAESRVGFMSRTEKTVRRRKSRPVNIRVPSPELPDSTDFVCGTLDEDRPLEDAYLSCLERRRAAKHKITPQDIDPSFPKSDPEMDEDDDDDIDLDQMASESDAHLMMHGQMDLREDNDLRGRRKDSKRRSPAASPKRLRSPPPSKRVLHRSPPPRKLFGQSPRRQPPAPIRLRSPPPTRRGSAMLSPKRNGMYIHFGGLAERPPVTTSASLPRTPVTTCPPELSDNEDTCGEAPVRRAIDIKIGLENKRLRRKEKLYQKLHRKGCKDKERRPPPGKGCERMREVGMGRAAHKGKQLGGFALGIPPTPDQKDIHVLSV